jgi:hypothetical protein
VGPDPAEIRPQGLLHATAQRDGQGLSPTPRLLDGSFQVWRNAATMYVWHALNGGGWLHVC